jgi:hypothetical protein
MLTSENETKTSPAFVAASPFDLARLAARSIADTIDLLEVLRTYDLRNATPTGKGKFATAGVRAEQLIIALALLLASD